MIAQGLTNKEIAAQLNLSAQTVKNHVHRILQKGQAATDLRFRSSAAYRNLPCNARPVGGFLATQIARRVHL